VTRPVNAIAAGSGITGLSGGTMYMLALKSDGTVLGWGQNGYGQLGNGTSIRAATLTQVTGLTSATQVAAGAYSSFAVHTVPYLIGL
jgi:alpha-tubulin suppressor-like RCC1 family protein